MRYLWYVLVAAMVSPVFAGAYDDLFRAVVSDNPQAVESLVRRGVDPNSVDPDGQPALMRALNAESSKVAVWLAAWPETDIERRNAVGESALMLAALRGEQEVLDTLLARGARLDGTGWTALHYAASGGNLQGVRTLIARGAEVDARAPNGRTPLMVAALYASEEVVDTLLAAGAARDVRDKGGATPLSWLH